MILVNLVAAAPASAHSGHWLADAPTTWENPPPMSTLHALLLFVGIPAALFVGITLLVMAPSIVKGPRYRPSEEWSSESEWFGAPVAGHTDARALESSSPTVKSEDSAKGAGGASAGW